MADGEKTSKAEVEKVPKASEAEKAPGAKAVVEAPKKTKLVAETGKYICKEPVVFMSPDGKRTIAKAGDVVAMHENDAKALKKRRLIESEEETAEA